VVLGRNGITRVLWSRARQTLSRILQFSHLAGKFLSLVGSSGKVNLHPLYDRDIQSGPETLTLHLIEIPNALSALDGVVMELHDCALPLLESVLPTADLSGDDWHSVAVYSDGMKD
jgi:hypothetical protein